DRCRRTLARSFRTHGRMGRGAAAGAPPDACLRHHGLPRLGARRPPPQAGRDERAAPRDGRHAELRPVQSRPSDLCGIEAVGYREAVRAEVTANTPLSSPGLPPPLKLRRALELAASSKPWRRRDRAIQYAAAVEIVPTSLEYWIVRFRAR